MTHPPHCQTTILPQIRNQFDPFVGTGTTSLAAANFGRNSIGNEIDQHYLDLSSDRLRPRLPLSAALEIGQLRTSAIEAA